MKIQSIYAGVLSSSSKLILFWRSPFSQEHKCQSDCESIGVCEIDTVPHSIEETFNGAHDQFQYTRVGLGLLEIESVYLNQIWISSILKVIYDSSSYH